MLDVFERVILLEDMEIFEHLDASALLAIAREMAIECFSEDMVICERGNRDDRFFMLVVGKAKVRRGERDIAWLGPHDCFWEISLFLGTEEPVRAMSVGDVICLSITRADLHRALSDRPTLAHTVIENVTRHLRARLQLPIALSAGWT
jgi:CRP-like cAMP-binding protein